MCQDLSFLMALSTVLSNKVNIKPKDNANAIAISEYLK